MNKLEYLRTLENTLQARLSQQEVNEIMRDYAEYFAEGTRQGKTDDEIAANLGNPIEVAQQVIAESEVIREQSAPISEKKEKNATAKVMMVVLGICLLPVAAIVAGGLLFAAAAVIGCGISLVGLAVAGVLLGILGLGAIVMYIAVLPPAAIAACITGCVAVVAAGVLVFCLSLQVVKLIWKLLCRCWAKLYTAVTKKPWPAPKEKMQSVIPPSFEPEESEYNA